ncbi:MAG: aminotransferase class V-fold PLP-dependent enzyme [Gemmataceae bacterium]
MSERPRVIYLDNNATTQVDPRVAQAMWPYYCEKFGNPGSRHHVFGREAEAAVEQARAQVAQLLNASPREIVFTSGATECNNLALKGVAAMHRLRGNHLISCVTEHHAVLDPLKRLEREGFRVTLLPVDREGYIDLGQLDAAISDQTILVSLMAANNEVGTLHPLKEIGALCKRRGVLFHTDAAQAAGRLPLDVEALGLDLVSISGHKMYGPKGIGALFIRRRSPQVRLEPLLEGGGQERGVRSGTLNVPGIVGLGLACELAGQTMAEEAARLEPLVNHLRSGLINSLEGVSLNGPREPRLPGNLNLSFAWVSGEALLMSLKGVALSAGSACTSANPEPSYVLRALGVPNDLAQASLRFGLGRFTTREEVDMVLDDVRRVVEQLRKLSPAYHLHRHQPVCS